METLAQGSGLLQQRLGFAEAAQVVKNRGERPARTIGIGLYFAEGDRAFGQSAIRVVNGIVRECPSASVTTQAKSFDSFTRVEKLVRWMVLAASSAAEIMRRQITSSVTASNGAVVVMVVASSSLRGTPKRSGGATWQSIPICRWIATPVDAGSQ